MRLSLDSLTGCWKSQHFYDVRSGQFPPASRGGKRNPFLQSAREHEVVPGGEQPQGIDLPAQDRSLPPALDQFCERCRLACIEIVDEIVQADKVETGLSTAEQALDMRQQVLAVPLLRI